MTRQRHPTGSDSQTDVSMALAASQHPSSSLRPNYCEPPSSNHGYQWRMGLSSLRHFWCDPLVWPPPGFLLIFSFDAFSPSLASEVSVGRRGWMVVVLATTAQFLSSAHLRSINKWLKPAAVKLKGAASPSLPHALSSLSPIPPPSNLSSLSECSAVSLPCQLPFFFVTWTLLQTTNWTQLWHRCHLPDCDYASQDTYRRNTHIDALSHLTT